MKAFQAYGADGSRATSGTPRGAALSFFASHPGRRRCIVVSGETDGRFFTVRYGRASEGDWPTVWRDVTPKTAATLPDVTP